MPLDPNIEIECHQARLLMRQVMGNKYEQRIKIFKDMLAEVQKKFGLPDVMHACSHCLMELDQKHHKSVDPDGWARAAFLAAALDTIQPLGMILNS